MTAIKTPNYTAAQEAMIVAASEAGPLNLDVAKSLAADPAMNTADGEARNYRSIVAKISRMGLTYDRKVAVSKDGSPITKKSDLVTRIATLAGVNAAKLEGMDKSPKGALEVIVAAFEKVAVNG
jgi:hypothetical protein